MATKSSNSNLHKAKNVKNDEFYTQMADIEREIKYYKPYFKDKVVYCNCDDPRVSNFFLYFARAFEHLGLKKLISSCYKSIEPDLFSQHDSEQAIYLDFNGEFNKNMPLLDETKIQTFEGDGDFRNQENIELLKQADIVVTNPPFSLFREYVAQLIKYDKKFLIIGSDNARTYKEVFGFIKENKLWGGINKVKEFLQRDGSIKKFGNIGWYTNLEHKRRNEEIFLWREYDENKYPKYFNFDAINIDKVSDIPYDYDGLMGVPISFLDKYNPNQFEIIGLGISNSGIEFGVKPYLPEHKKYRKEIQKRGAVDGDLYMIENGKVKVPYARIIIKNKQL